MSEQQAEKTQSFGKDVLKLVSGTAIAQIIGVISAPILSRLYEPEAFGVTALFISITGIVLVIASGRYELTILLPKNEKIAANLFFLSNFFVVVTSLILFVAVLFFSEPIAHLLNAPEIAPYLILVPLALLAQGFFKVLNYWSTRIKEFGKLSISKGLSSLLNTLCQLGFGFTGFATGGYMILSNVIGFVGSSYYLGHSVFKKYYQLLKRSVSVKKSLYSLKRYKEFPIFGTWASLLNEVSWQLPAFMLAYFFNPTIVGFYALGNRVLRLPMNFIGGAIGQVFFQRASEANVQAKLKEVVLNVFEKLFKIGFLPLLILTLTGEDFFVVIFGQKWGEAGIYTQILSLWSFLWFISSPLSKLFSVLEIQDRSLWINFWVFITRFVSLLVGGLYKDIYVCLALFSLSGILVYGSMNIYLLLKAGVSRQDVFQVFETVLKKSFLFFICVISIKYLTNNSALIVAFSILNMLLYFYFILKTDKEMLALFKKIRGKIG